MKRTIFLMLAIGVIISAQAQDKPKKVSSKIKEVTVFLSGAQVTETGETMLIAGASTLIFEDLTAGLNPQTIQIKGEGDFTILSVVHQLNYLKSLEKSKEVLNIEDSLKILKRNLDYQQAMLLVFQQEEAMLIANKVIGGDAGTKPADLQTATEYFRTRLTDIKINQLSVMEKIAAIQQRTGILNNQLATWNANAGQPTSEVIVSIAADAAVYAKFSLSYLVYNAGWIPSYDLRAIDVKSPIQLGYKGNVWQTTGVNWDNVKLTLCTGNPQQSGVKPTINACYLSFYTPVTYYGYDKQENMERENAPSSGAGAGIGTKTVDDSRTGADYTVVTENQTNIDFEISIPYSIPTDGKKYTVEIQKNSLDAIYEYYCAPKVDNDVFLLARVSGWEQYNLMPGEVNLFFEGTYVGQSYIDTRYTKDTLEFSLGRDKGISVTREKIQDLSSTKYIGTNTKITYAYKISVKNKKKQGINLVIEDQAPVTTDKDIVIEIINIDGAVQEEFSGKLTWKFSLKSAETKEISLSYSIKYPKDKSINSCDF